MRFVRRKLAVSVLAVLLIMGLTVGATFAQSDRDALFTRVRTVFELVEKIHKNGADLDTFINGAIQGGLQALGDPHTNYYPPTDYQGFLDSLNGTFTGIGAYLEQDGTYVLVAAPIKNTPAFKAGLQSGDRILEANGTSLVGSTVEKAVQLIRGPAGTNVTLKIERPSEGRTFTVTITRAVISIPEVESKMLDNQIGYIQLSSFGDEVVRLFYEAADELKAKGAKAFVLDLRQNPGGYLQAAVDIAGAFVPAEQPVVWQVYRSSKEAMGSRGLLVNLPVAVLVDKGTASASEILAGAIQDYGVGPLIGTKTFGKGTVQQILSMQGGGGMKITIAEYLTPKERKVHGVGLTPDYEVENPKPSDERTKPLEFTRYLQMSSVGLDVLYLQYRLEDLGFSPDTDGYFGLKTQRAVDAFAWANGLTIVNSMVDKQFIETLNQKVSQIQRTPTKVDAQLQKAVELLGKKLSTK